MNARLLGTELMGVWATATVVYAYLPFLPLGVDHGAYRQIPLLRGAGRRAEVEEVRDAYLAFALGIALAAALAVLIASLVLPLDPRLARSLQVVAVMGFLASLGRWAIIVLKADHKFGAAGLCDALKQVGLLASVPLVFFFGLPGLWIGNLVGVGASTSAAIRACGLRPRLRWNPAVIKRLSAFGLPIMMVSLAEVLLTTGDKMLVLGALGTSALGIYSLGRSFTQLLLVTGGVVSAVVYPRITERFGATGDPSHLRNLVVLPTLGMGATLPLLICFAWFGLPVAIGLLLPAFVPGVHSAQWLFVATAFFLTSGTADYLLVALGRQMLSLLLYASGVALTLGLEYVALRAGLGMDGVAQAAASGSLTYAVVLVVVALAYCHVPWRQRASTAAWAVLPLAAVVAGCVAVEHLWPAAPGEPAGVMIAGALARAAVVSSAALPIAISALNRAYPGWTATFRAWRGP